MGFYWIPIPDKFPIVELDKNKGKCDLNNNFKTKNSSYQKIKTTFSIFLILIINFNKRNFALKNKLVL